MTTRGKQQLRSIKRLATWQKKKCQEDKHWAGVRDALSEVASAASDQQLFNLASTANSLSEIMDIAICNAGSRGAVDDCANPLLDEIPAFVQDSIGHINECFEAEFETDDLTIIQETIQERWGEFVALALTDSNDEFQLAADDSNGEYGDNCDDAAFAEEPSSGGATEQIDLMLSVLKNSAASEQASTTDETKPQEDTKPQTESLATVEECPLADFVVSDEPPQPPTNLSISDELKSDEELRFAFLDDAQHCLAEMEKVVLDSDQNQVEERLRNFCRQLHTLKGASATVDLSELASYLHQLESWLEYKQKHTTEGSTVDDDTLLQAIDSVRSQVSLLENLGEAEPLAVANDPQPAASGSNCTPSTSQPSADKLPAQRSSSSLAAPSRENSVRVRADQLDKLMDMLAELVVIRNRRETRVNEIYEQKEELTRCTSRLRKFNDQHFDHLRTQRDRLASSGTSAIVLGIEPTSSTALSEIANDVTEVSRQLEDAFKPVSEENLALTHFIRQFRQELMQLSRLPVSGLFQRLNRAARDAAKSENKQVKLHLVGEETGVEQTVQEKLFDPLLHMVRNCVSHGIELSEDRLRVGKTEQGNITLSASASSSMLVVTISDDGRGLDFDAIRSRGFERGLLSPNSIPSNKQLAKLIFHPGFSTRDQASEISGRGIGMDVVSTTLDRMQGRIEVDSTPGSGTTMRISIPLATGIEHAMIFRAGTQLFALPMRSISSAEKEAGDQQLCSLESLLSGGRASDGRLGPALMLDETRGFTVDEVLGPEEVVVRPLPAMLRRHPLFSGAILAGNGRTVLMLSPDRLQQLCSRNAIDHQSPKPAATTHADEPARQHTTEVLVVDDSLSARKALAKRLRQRGMLVTEANDGLNAIEYLQRGVYQVVFTDLDMPRMSGLELLAEMKQSGLSDAKVVVVSSRPKADVWDRVSGLGAVEFLSKPVSKKTLDELFENKLNNKPSE